MVIIIKHLKFDEDLTLDQALQFLGKNPKVIDNNIFDDQCFILNKNGIYVPAYKLSITNKLGRDTKYLDLEEETVETNYDRLIPAYVASDFGFRDSGVFFLNEYFYPELLKKGILPLDPFLACGEHIQEEVLDKSVSVEEHEKRWLEFNQKIGPVNYAILMHYSKILIANAEGVSIDDGVSTELGHYSAKYKGKPIIVIRSDLRPGENPGSPANPAVICKADYIAKGFDIHPEVLDLIKKEAEEKQHNSNTL